MPVGNSGDAICCVRMVEILAGNMIDNNVESATQAGRGGGAGEDWEETNYRLGKLKRRRSFTAKTWPGTDTFKVNERKLVQIAAGMSVQVMPPNTIMEA